MRMNWIEKALVNSLGRALLQQWYEAPFLERLGGRVDGRRVLEVGCGQGTGVEIILERFAARQVDAFDLDPDMIGRARRRLSSYQPDRVRLWVGDATAIDAEDESYDAVFDFAIIHHVPAWRSAVAEVHRVLRPGGRFFFEEVTSHALDRLAYRTFLDHPKTDRFSGHEFVAELERVDIAVGRARVERFFGDFVVGVGRRDDASALGVA